MSKNKTMSFKPTDFVKIGTNTISKMIGKRFGKLVVIEYVGICNKKRYYLCQCDCGNLCYAHCSSLLDSSTKSCGCLKKGRKKTHFKTLKDYKASTLNQQELRNKIKHLWEGIMGRCYNNKRDNYLYYGGRGIKVCDDWHNFDNFYNWAIKNNYQYVPNQKQNVNLLSIDRINPDGDYEPNNCRFVLPDIQARNKRLLKQCPNQCSK